MIKINWKEWDWDEIIDRTVMISAAVAMMGMALASIFGCIILLLKLILGGN